MTTWVQHRWSGSRNHGIKLVVGAYCSSWTHRGPRSNLFYAAHAGPVIPSAHGCAFRAHSVIGMWASCRDPHKIRTAQPCWPVADLNLTIRSAGTLPRSFTSMPCALAHPRHSSCSGLLLLRVGCHGLACGRCHRPGGPHPRTGPAHPAILRVPGVQIDLILGAVQPEAERPLGRAAVEIINEQGLNLLSHGRPDPLNGYQRDGVCSLAGQAGTQAVGTLSRLRSAHARQSQRTGLSRRGLIGYSVRARTLRRWPGGAGSRTRRATNSNSGLYHATRDVRSSLYQVNIWVYRTDRRIGARGTARCKVPAWCPYQSFGREAYLSWKGAVRLDDQFSAAYA